jgi:hypothetical protein
MMFGSLEETNPTKAVVDAVRRRRRRRKNTGGSVCSSPSLLDMTIEEETLNDLEESSSCASEKKETLDHPPSVPIARTKSAPHLAGYPPSPDRHNVTEDVHMTGMNSYRRVEIFRAKTDSRRSIADQHGEREVPENHRRRSRSLTAPIRVRRFVSPSPPPRPEPKAPAEPTRHIWRRERALRDGIHAPAVASSSGSEDSRSIASSPSLLREARIRRLQLQSLKQEKHRSRSLGAPKKLNRRQVSPDPSIDNKSDLSRRTDPGPFRHVSPDRSQTTQGSIPSQATDPSSSFLLDSLDASLAQLYRPYDVEYGPEERSV